MKRQVLFVLLILMCVFATADDTYFFLASGGLKPMYDEETSVVWGMPGNAVKAGAVDEILPISRIAQRIIDLVAKNDRNQ